MSGTDYEAALRAATKGCTAAASATTDTTGTGQLTMLAHRLFDTTRAAFCPENPGDTDRMFGIDTENEQLYQRAVQRAALARSHSPKAIALLTEAVRIIAGWARDSHASRQSQARALIRAVDAVYETLEPLAPITPNPATDWQTRRPAFR